MSIILHANFSNHPCEQASVVALHCSMGSKKQWSGLVNECRGTLNVAAYDLNGYGDNPPVPGPAPSSLDAEARHLHRDLDALPGPLHLVGHSFGGAVAFELAGNPRFACRIRSLTLIEPVLPGALLEHEEDRPAYEAFAQESTRICTALWLGDRHVALRQFLTFWNGPGYHDRLSDGTKAELLARIDKLTGDFSAIFAATDVANVARRLSMPTLLISGGQSPAPVRRIVKRLASGIRRARHVGLPGAGHMLALTHAAEINPLISQHIASSIAIPAAVVPLRRSAGDSGTAVLRVQNHTVADRFGF
jgi:pimeloyl-ACP methyl ester carboxylesterase